MSHTQHTMQAETKNSSTDIILITRLGGWAASRLDRSTFGKSPQ